MNDSIFHDAIIEHLLQWAGSRDDVRAVLLTSTRTRPDIPVDPFSDYDVILAVTDIRPYVADRGWLGDFGPVLVVYRDPVRVEHGCERFACITQYENDRLKIDFTVVQAAWLAHVAAAPALPDELDGGYRVLLDKDDLTRALKPPTYRAFVLAPPGEVRYLELIEVFFHEATYVAKALWRGDLLPAKASLHIMQASKLRQMLEWRAAIDSGWTFKPGAYGKGLKKHIRPDLWAALEQTYVGAGTAENWDALFQAVDLFRTVALEVGDHLGYAYPHAMDRGMMAYLSGVKNLPRDA